MSDLKFAIRQLLKNPGFAAIVVLSLSIGIAANTTVFSFVNALLFRPAPVDKPDELWQVWRQRLSGGSPFESFEGLSYPGYVEFRNHTESFDGLAAFDPETPFVSWNREGIGRSIQCQFVSGDFFRVCGVPAVVGRPFSAEEDRQPGADPVAVVSYSFYKNNLSANPQVVGQTLTINGVSLLIIGVAPPGFTGLLAGLSPDLWVPFMMAPTVLHDPEWHTRAGSFSLFGVGRLKPGVNAKQAQAELTGLMRNWEEKDTHNRGFAAAVFRTTMVPMPFRGFVSTFTGLLMGAVGLVLLIACANAANLMLARGVARNREMAVRSSVGASRWRLIRQCLTESTLLATISGTVALLLTYWFIPLLLRLSPPTLPIRPVVQFDARVFAFTALTAFLTGILFGLAPAWQGTKVNLAQALKRESVTTSARQSHLASFLIAGQVAVCFVLLIAGALCLRSLFNAQNVNLGFEVKNRMTAEVQLKDLGYSEKQTTQFNTDFVKAASALPGIESVSFADYLPLDSRFLGITYNPEGQQPPPGQDGYSIQTFDVGPQYFTTMGTTLESGREFLESDREGAPMVAVVNQALADRFWPGQNAVGRRLVEGKPGQGDNYEIVGVVKTGKYRTLGENSSPVIFRSRLQHPGTRTTFVFRTHGDVRSALASIRSVQQSLDPRLSLSRLGTLEEHLALALFPARVTGLLFSVFGGVALLLAVSGLFGVVAYSVSQRTREFGIRFALGANRRNVVSSVLRQGSTHVGFGVSAGVLGAVIATRFLRGILYGVSPLDPIAFLIVALLLATVSLMACLLPAWRAARVDPMQALRYE